MLVPAAAFGFGERVGLGVVVEVVGAVVEEEVGTIEAAVLPWGAVLREEDGVGEFPVEEIVRPGEADDGCAFFVAGTGIGVPCAEVAAVDFEGFAAGVQVFVAEDAADGEVEFCVLRVGSRGPTRASRFQCDEVVRGGEAGLVAGAVEADVEHVELVVGAEDDGVVDAALVEVAFVAGGVEDELGIFVGCAVGGERVGEGEGWGCCCGCCDGCSAEELAAGVHGGLVLVGDWSRGRLCLVRGG